jgi:hypothetical protein
MSDLRDNIQEGMISIASSFSKLKKMKFEKSREN